MALNNIIFVKGKGGLGRPLPGKDYISAFAFYTGTLPAGFSATDRIKQIFSLSAAEALGITNDYSDETQAMGSFSISNPGDIGNTLSIFFKEPSGVKLITTYTKSNPAATTNTLVAVDVAAAVNSGTTQHGYKATTQGTLVKIFAKKGLGIFPNTGDPLSLTFGAGNLVANTIVQPTGGVASLKAVWHYHISEFFRIQPKGFLWLGFFAVPVAYNYSELLTLQTAAQGDIRQFGVFVDSKAFAIGDLTVCQGVCDVLDSQKTGVSVLYAGNIAAVSDITTLSDLALLSNNKLSVVIGQDGGATGNALFHATGKSITCLGATLGAVALSAVQEDIAWVGKFNMSDGVELESIAFANGVKFSDASINPTLLDAVDLKRYIFLRKFPNKAGTYFNENHTACSPSSDYAYINDNRVIDKAIRCVDEDLLPSLNSPLRLNANGTLANSTIAYLESQAIVKANQMVRDGEASEITVTVDTTENVGSTGTVKVAIDIVPTGTARNIIVNIGYKITA